MTATVDSKQNVHKSGFLDFIPARYVLAIMSFFGGMLQFSLKVYLSVTIVAMVGTKPSKSVLTNEQDVCPGGGESSQSSQEGEFDWDPEIQSYILGAYYYGYVATQLLGGRLSEMFGTKIVMGLGLLIGGILTILSPLAARWNVAAFITVRSLVGAANGVCFPSLQVIISKWYPPQERTTFGSIIYAAASVGAVISTALSGILAEIGDWTLVSYFFGGAAILWFVPWLLLVYNTPEEHPRISYEEKQYIIANIGREKYKVSLPVTWFAILTSAPVWAYCLASSGIAYITMTFMTELPMYLSSILHFDLKASGGLSSLPYLFSAVSGIFCGSMSQWLRARGYVSHATAYRIFNTIGMVGGAIPLFVITLLGCDSTSIVAMLLLTALAIGGFSGASLMNHLDLANNFSGTVAGLSYTTVSIVGIITPIVAGAITKYHQTLTQWHIVFYISVGVTLCSYVVVVLFSSVEEQSWNKPDYMERKKTGTQTNSGEEA